MLARAAPLLLLPPLRQDFLGAAAAAWTLPLGAHDRLQAARSLDFAFRSSVAPTCAPPTRLRASSTCARPWVRHGWRPGGLKSVTSTHNPMPTQQAHTRSSLAVCGSLGGAQAPPQMTSAFTEGPVGVAPHCGQCSAPKLSDTVCRSALVCFNCSVLLSFA